MNPEDQIDQRFREHRKQKLLEAMKQIHEQRDDAIQCSLAIMEIRDRELWKLEFDTFDRFCRRTLGVGENDAVEMCQLVLENYGIKPPSKEGESHE